MNGGMTFQKCRKSIKKAQVYAEITIKWGKNLRFFGGEGALRVMYTFKSII